MQQAVAMLEVVRRRMSARLAVIRAEGAAAASFAAVALRQLLRCSGCSALRPNRRPGQRYPTSDLLPCAALAASLRRGGSAGRASVRLSIVWTLHANLNVTPVLHELRLHVERRAARTRGSRFRPAWHQETSPTPRGAVALLLRRGLLPGCKSQSTGLLAPRGLDGRDVSSEGTPT